MALGGFVRGFAISLGTTNFNSPGNYQVGTNYRALVVTANNGNPGNPGNTAFNNCCPPGPGNPGSPGNPTTFNGAGTATYQRSASTIAPRLVVGVVIGTGGAAGNGNPSNNLPVGGFPGNPGTSGNPGSLSVQVT